MHLRQTLAPGCSRFCSELVTRQRVPSWTGSGGAHAASLVSGHWVAWWKFAIRAYRSDSKPRTCDTMASNMLYEPFE